VTEAVDPDPVDPAAVPEGTTLGGRQEPADGDPTAGGKRGDIGTTESIAADEPDDGNRYPAGGGDVAEEQDPPAGPTGPDA
jgi:hypothetical protein